jgi:eukaryotic-like serine/threonine-protein kinase
LQGTQVILQVGNIVHNRYIIERLLGKGGFGAVYLVRDKRVKGNVFALKEIIDPDKKELENFMFEGGILAKLDHPALPRVYRTFEDSKSGRAYMLMDYVEGPNLEVLRKKQLDRRFSVSRTLKILASIIEAVSYLHHQQPPIIHRDIKPANIIVPESEDSSVLVDFGVAKEYDKDSTTSVVRRCSPGYAAPEQYAKGTDARTDIYALASTCYTLLTGQIAADALHRMTSMGSQQDDPLVPVKELVPTVPQHVSDAISKAMSINKNARFATAEEFWQAMNALPIEDDAPVVELVPLSEQNHDAAIPDTENISSVSTHSREHGWKSGTLVKLLAIVAVVVLLVGAIFSGGFFLFSQNTVHQSTTFTARTTPVPSQATPLPTSIPTSVPTVSPSPSPTVPPLPTTSMTNHPTLASAYNGTILDRYTTPPTGTSMSLNQVRQQGANISGYFSVGPGLSGNGPFNGTVSVDHKIQFTAPGSAGFPPLLFQGTVQPNGSISGTYCSARNDQCDYTAGGYGSWNVSPAGG